MEARPGEARIALCFAALKAGPPDFPQNLGFVLAMLLARQLSCRSLLVFSVDRSHASSSGVDHVNVAVETLREWRASTTQQESDLPYVLKQVKPRQELGLLVEIKSPSQPLQNTVSPPSPQPFPKVTPIPEPAQVHPKPTRKPPLAPSELTNVSSTFSAVAQSRLLDIAE